MASRNFSLVDYTEIIPSSFGTVVDLSSGEFHEHTAVQSDWGQMQMADLVLPSMHLVRFKADITRDIRIKEYHDGGPDTVNTCALMNGHIESEFYGVGKRMGIRKGNQNFIYKPEFADDHYLKAQHGLELLHFSIDRSYYAGLLCDHEKWSAGLKEKLLRKEAVAGPENSMDICPEMYRIVREILTCPLSGHLRKMIIEAKVLEFTALQWHHLITNRQACKFKFSSADRDTFFALRDYLADHFTEELTLMSLARKFGLNEFKLKKGFKELFQTTVFDHIHTLKMSHARQLLLDEKRTVNEVAGIVGYKNPNHFSAAFKREFGVTPMSIRNS